MPGAPFISSGKEWAQGWAGSDAGRAGRQEAAAWEKFSLIQRNTPCESSRLFAVRRAAYCINLPQPANHRTCNDQTRTTVSSTGQDNEPDVFAGEDQ